MKLRESSMPEEAYWESLMDVPLILDRLGIGRGLKRVAEFGCGYGTFTIPVAQRTGGLLDTFDVEPDMLQRTQRRAIEAGLSNVHCHRRDVFAEGFGLADESSDACLLFNILHGEEPVRLLTEAARVTQPEGLVFVIHWRYDPQTPRGPSLDIRPRPEQIATWAETVHNLRPDGGAIDLPSWHYGWRIKKLCAGPHPNPR